MKKFIIMGIVIVSLSIALAFSLSSDNVMGISVSQLGNAIEFENLGTTDYVVFVRYPSGADERIVLNAGESYLLTNRPQPIEISAVSK
ncbi:hypothetical protein ES707_07813 [subsurface metagenome]